MPPGEPRSQSALSELDGAVRSIASDEVGIHSVTPDDLRARLAKDLWWKACAEAVHASPDRLVEWYRATTGVVIDVLAGRDRGLIDSARAVTAVAMALAAGGGKLDSETPRAALQRAVKHWSAAWILPDIQDFDGTRDLTNAEVSEGTRQALAIAAELPTGPARSLAVLALTLMTGEVTALEHRQRVRILFDAKHIDQTGRAGVLEMAIVPGGPPGLYPDLRTMSFLRGDEGFADSLTNAWAFANGDERGSCVLWSITQPSEDMPLINGGSLGAAFATALVELLGKRSLSRFTPWRMLRVFGEKCAVTGTVSADGGIGRVGGLDSKFEAAHARRWSVVAPAANRQGDLGVPPGVRVHWVTTVGQARRAAQRWVPNRVIAAILTVIVAVAFTLGTLYLTGVIADLDSSGRTAEAERRAKTAQILIAKADGMRRQQPTEALRVGLAAVAVADTPSTRGALIAGLTSARVPNPLSSGAHEIKYVGIAANGTALVVSESAATVWNVSDRANPRQGAAIGGPKDPMTGIRTAAMTDDGTLALLVAKQHPHTSASLTLWNTAETQTSGFTTLESCTPVASAINGKRGLALIGCAEGTVSVWQTSQSGMVQLGTRFTGLHAITITPSGNAAIIASDQGVSMWSLATPTAPTAMRSQTASFSNTPTHSIALDEAGRTALLGQPHGQSLLVQLDQQSSERQTRYLGIIGQDQTVSSVALSGDGRIALTANEGPAAVLWGPGDKNTSNPYRPHVILRGHSGQVTAVALSRDGRTALTGSRDGVVNLWDVTDRGQYSLMATRGLLDSVKDVQLSPTSTTAVVTTANGQASVWDVATLGNPERRAALTRATVRSVRFSPDGAIVAVGTEDGTVVLLDLTDSASPAELGTVTGFAGPVEAMAFSPREPHLAVGGQDGTVTLYDIAPGQPVKLGATPGGGPPVSVLAFDPRQATLAVGHHVGTVRLYDVTNPAAPREASIPPRQPGTLNSLAFSPATSTLLQSVDQNNAIVQWNADNPGNPQQLAKLVGHADPAHTIAYRRDGLITVTASGDGTAIVWSLVDRDRPHPMAVLAGHTGPVLTVGFTSDGGAIVTGGADGNIITWDISQLAAIATNPVSIACQAAGRGLNEAEWDAQVPGFTYQDSCAP